MQRRKDWIVSIGVGVGLAIAPAALGFVIAEGLRRSLSEIPRLYASAPLTAAVQLAGVVLSVVLAIAWLLRLINRRRHATQLAGAQAQVIAQANQQAAEERRRFLRRLDHELKNPLTAIHAGLANLGQASSEHDRRDALTSLEAQTLRISTLVAHLRKLAELETRWLERTPIDVAALLEEACSTIKALPAAAERNITLSVPQAPWPLPHVSGDWDLLFLAVYNLLDNALKFTQADDTVEIRASEDRDDVLIEIADTGPGIPEEDLPHVWEELYRSANARGVPGSGLGLSLVRAIIERHGGRVAVRSRAGQGTVFTLRLPTITVTESSHVVAKR